MKVIFLDVDGVLNYEGCTFSCGRYVGVDPAKIKLLNHIVDETNAIIVLTSTWKMDWEPILKDQQTPLGNYLDRELRKGGLKIRDKTWDYPPARGEGIKRWIKERPVESFVILDDCVFDYEREGITDRFVHTRWKDGLTEEDAQKAITILNTKI